MTTKTERELFFNALPPDEFTPLEVKLRQALMDWLGSRPGPFTLPLMEWIERRLGLEIATANNDAGQCEIRLQDKDVPKAPAAPTPAEVAENFFAALPTDAFLPEEEALRNAIIDFLAGWTSQALATKEDLGKSKLVQGAARPFLPPEVAVEDWMQARIGGEVSLKKDPKTGKLIVEVSPETRTLVAQRFKVMKDEAQAEAARARAAAAGKAMPEESGPVSPQARPVQTAAPAGPAARGKGPSKGTGKDKGKRPSGPDKEEWFAALPTDSLTGEEVELRQALLDFLNDAYKRGKGAGKGGYLSMSIVLNERTVLRAKESLLPASVQVKEWIDRRIGGEVDVRKDETGILEIALRNYQPPRSQDTSSSAPPRKAADAPAAGPATTTPPRASAGATAEQEFFRRLPEDELTPLELDLRQALLDLLAAKGGPVPLIEASKDRAIGKARHALMGPDVPLREWLRRRIGGEVEVYQENRVFLVRLHGGAAAPGAAAPAEEPAAAEPAPAGPAAGEGREGEKMSFFASLPEDRFLPDEERLREALLTYLDNWKSKDPPRLTTAQAESPNVAKYRALVLPKGAAVSLGDWITYRIGEELETQLDERGNQVFGRRGELQKLLKGKRPREEPRGQSGGKGAGGAGGYGYSSFSGKDGGKGGKGPGGPPWKRARDDGGKGGRPTNHGGRR